jgi:hypothetical protein
MGKELISASGKGHKTITYNMYVIVAGITGVTTVVFLAMVAMAKNDELSGIPINVWIPFILFLLALYIFFHLPNKAISKTAVYVYEDIVKGLSIDWMMQLTDFQLTYDQVSSVDVVGENKLVINTANAKHTIYAMNAKEVRDVIIAQKNAVNKN